jgi:50S ribosome-binding GTPase
VAAVPSTPDSPVGFLAPAPAVPDQGSPLLGRVQGLLTDALAVYQGTPAEEQLRAAAARLSGPLRVALAGRLKAGKSTLLNALVGERLAATDATECTRVVTWYANGIASRAWAYPHDGERRQLRFSRSDDGQTVIDLGSFRAEELDRLEVEIPSGRLARLTLIDTPGIASLSTDVSARTTTFLTSGTDRGSDAVLYLMRHLHASDVGFLEAFHDEQFAGATPVNAIGILSRSDEIGAGRSDALELAWRVAAEYKSEPRVRALVQTVVPVSALLAQAGNLLRETEYAALSTVANGPDSVLLSADRFVSTATTPSAAAQRKALLAGLGLFGVRLSVGLLRLGLAEDAGALARQLAARSGLEELRRLLLDQFTERQDVLKAQHALRALEGVLAATPMPGAERLRSRVEATVVGAHELTELRLLNDLRTGVIELPDHDRGDEAESLLGANGTAIRARLRLAADAPEDEIRPALLAVLRRWQRLRESPIADPATRRTADVLRRTCEGLLVTVRQPTGDAQH